MSMGNRPGEVRREGDLHGGEARRLAIIARQNPELLAGVGETRAFTEMVRKVMKRFCHP